MIGKFVATAPHMNVAPELRIQVAHRSPAFGRTHRSGNSQQLEPTAVHLGVAGWEVLCVVAMPVEEPKADEALIDRQVALARYDIDPTRGQPCPRAHGIPEKPHVVVIFL